MSDEERLAIDMPPQECKSSIDTQYGRRDGGPLLPSFELPPFLATLPCGCLVGTDDPVATYLALARLVKAHECPFATEQQ